MQTKDIPFGDKKFYYQIHVSKQKAQWLTPCSYSGFCYRLSHGMNLHDAILSPRVEYQVRDKKLTPTIQDNIRRRQVLNEENIQILDFEQIDKVLFKKRDYKMARYNMKPPKKTLLQKFISYFKKLWQKKES